MRIAERARERGLITEEQLREVAREPDEALIERGYLTSSQFAALAREISGAETLKLAPPEEKTFGKYVLVKQVGQGGFGAVYRAYEKGLGRTVALKFLHSEDPEDLQRFTREAQTAAALAHPHIVPLHEVGEAEGRHYLAMEFIEGATLSKLRVEPRRALEIVRDVAGAVQYAHEKGIVHRDLKPQNVMMGEDGHVWVMDFGLARRLKGGTTLTVTGAIVGTPAYMPPEQARGDRCDVRSDVYSLGAVLYELVTGHSPYEAGDAIAILDKVRSEDPVAPRRLNPKLDREIETIVAKAMDKVPERRYRSAREFAQDIDRHLRGEPIVARPASTLYRIRKFVARRRLVLAIGTAGLCGMAIVGTLVGRNWLRERDAKREVERQKADADLLSRERDRSLKEIAALWTQVLEAKADMYSAASDPAVVRRNLAASIDRIGAYIERHPDHPQGYFVRARARFYLDQMDEAEADLREALRLEPEFLPAEALLAQVLFDRYTYTLRGLTRDLDLRRKQGGELLEEAIRRLDHARQGGEDVSVERWGLIRTREDDWANVITRAMHAAWSKDNERAREILRRANDENESEEYCYWLFVVADDPKKEEEWLLRVVARRPLYAKAWLSLGVLRMEHGNPAKAVEDYTKALSIVPYMRLAHHFRGAAKSRIRDFAGAIEDLTEALRIEPPSADALNLRGIARAETGDRDGAMADFTQATLVEPDIPGSYTNRARLHCDAKDWNAAVEDCTIALRLDPKNSSGYLYRGRARKELGQTEEALLDLDAYLRLAGEDSKILVQRGLLEIARGRTEAALVDFSRAIRADSKSPEAYRQRGIALEKLSKWAEAVADYEEALKHAPQTWYRRADVESRLKRVRALRDQ